MIRILINFWFFVCVHVCLVRLLFSGERKGKKEARCKQAGSSLSLSLTSSHCSVNPVSLHGSGRR
jgi:hypothetical protein